jgi:hypothetical protein
MGRSEVAEMDRNAPGVRTPEEVADATWVKSVGGVATPLLGGFSLASVIVVSDDAAKFRWPGPAILALTVAAVVLIAAVQFAQVASGSYEARADLSMYGRKYNEHKDPMPEFEQEGYDQRASALAQAQHMSKWTRNLYHVGTDALMLGLVLALAPKQEGAEGDLRWCAFSVAAVVFVLQVLIMSRPASFRTKWASGQESGLIPRLRSWFRANDTQPPAP